MKIRILFIAVSLLMSINCFCQTQGISNNWLMGYSSWYGPPFGQSKIDFFTGVASIYSDSLEMDMRHTFTNISDTSGNLLFYTNGYYIADATNDPMQNGSGINPSTYTSYCSDGLGIPQANVILPYPNHNNLYCLIHSTADMYPSPTCSYNLYFSVIDMSLNGGLGGVTTKNQILYTDSMVPGKIAACKHANGRDWWIFVHRLNSNMFFKFLLTPSGVSGPTTQNIGNIRSFEAGEAWFSPDGTRYAYYYITDGLDVYDFDRCTGILSNPIHVNIPFSGGYNVGMAISPNSNVLYVTNTDSVMQFDLTAANITASQQTVAVYDSFTSTYPGWPALSTYFGLMSLAPDGKIYITTGNSTHHLHVINQPDSLGIACSLVQHGVQLPSYAFNTLPNHPNYFLGRDTGSVCDTITVWMGEQNLPPPKEKGIKVLPNPNDGRFTLWFTVHDKPGWVEVYDVTGKLILKEPVAPWSQYKQLNIQSAAAPFRDGVSVADGIYFVKMLWGMEEGSCKVMVQR